MDRDGWSTPGKTVLSQNEDRTSWIGSTSVVLWARKGKWIHRCNGGINRGTMFWRGSPAALRWNHKLTIRFNAHLVDRLTVFYCLSLVDSRFLMQPLSRLGDDGSRGLKKLIYHLSEPPRLGFLLNSQENQPVILMPEELCREFKFELTVLIFHF